jgi:hypothetical protein
LEVDLAADEDDQALLSHHWQASNLGRAEQWIKAVFVLMRLGPMALCQNTFQQQLQMERMLGLPVTQAPAQTPRKRDDAVRLHEIFHRHRQHQPGI